MITEFPTEYLPAALAIVAKANKRAAKQGITEQFTTKHETKEVKRIDPNTGLGVVRSMTTFEVVGAPLCFAGWTFVGTITWDSETGLAVTRPVPGTNVDLSAHRDAQRCDHCHTKRQRKDTYVVARTDGTTHGIAETKQVGSNCMAAFLGIDPSHALWMLGFEDNLASELDEAFGSYHVELRPTTTFVLGLASAAVAQYGWRSSQEDKSTASRVWDVIRPPRPNQYNREVIAAADALAASVKAEGSAAQERADAILAWVRSDDFAGNSEYVLNLKAAVAGETVSERNVNLVVSAVSAWKRANEEAVAKAAAPVSTHVGAVKERLRSLKLEVTMTRWFEGDYGTTTLIGFVDDSGNRFKWFASGHYDFEAGDKVVLTGTVKEHTEYKGTLETVLTRCKIEEA